MNQSTENNLTNRRDFLKTTGKLAAVSALAGVAIPNVHAAGDETIQVALIGCGGRGTGAAANALSVQNGPIKLVAMADVFEDRLSKSYDALQKDFGARMDVADRKFIGFDAYKKAMDCLKPGDVAIFTTPLAFRWVHFAYAIEKNLNVFMEKPLTADGPTSKRMLELGEKSVAKNLKVGVGLMSRHSKALRELKKRIEDGAIGDIILMRGYRMAPGPLASAFSEKWPGKPSELLWQISRFHSFIWASGGCFSDFYIHHIDHCCWMKNAWPERAQALGGRHYRYDYVDQNFDSYSVEYTFPDGAKFIMDGRCMNGANAIYSSYAHGSKGSAVIARSGDWGNGQPSSIYKGQKFVKADAVWESNHKGENPYQNEWDALIEAIRKDKKHNEVKRGVYASIATSMGRMAAHTAQEITWDDMLNSPHEYAPNADKFTNDTTPPVTADANGRYPVPQPGKADGREYPLTVA